MIAIDQPYLSATGIVKTSRAKGSFRFQHRTQGLAVKYVTQGQEIYQVGGQRVPVAAGQLLFLPEGTPYLAYNNHHHPHSSGICIDVHHRSTSPLSWGIPLHGMSIGQHLSGCSSTVDWQQVMQQLTESLDRLDSFLEKMKPGLEASAKKLDTQRHLLSCLLHARRWIRAHYHESFRLADLARRVGLSTYHFQRLFKACFQQSPQQMQQELRLAQAQQWLADPTKSLSDIACRLGYTDLPAFSRAFKKKNGIPPSKVRADLL